MTSLFVVLICIYWIPAEADSFFEDAHSLVSICISPAVNYRPSVTFRRTSVFSSCELGLRSCRTVFSPPSASRPKSDVLTCEAFHHLRGVSPPMLAPPTAHCVSWLHSCICSLLLEDRVLSHPPAHSRSSGDAAWMKEWRNEWVSLSLLPGGTAAPDQCSQVQGRGRNTWLFI